MPNIEARLARDLAFAAEEEARGAAASPPTAAAAQAATPPSAGGGASMALESAVVLAEELARVDDVVEHCHRWPEYQMRTRMKLAQAMEAAADTQT